MIRPLLITTALIASLSAAVPAPAAPAAAKSCRPAVFAPAGTYTPSRSIDGPALVLSGAGLMTMPYEQVLPWLRAHVAAPAGRRAGNLLILKASGERDYSDLFYKHSRLASIQEVLIPPCASRSAVDSVVPYVQRANFVLFAGGDQSHYTAWKGSKLIAAVRNVYARGGIVGGGSAGLAIQGQVIFDSAAADRILPDDEDVGTADAIRNPAEPAISFTTGFFEWPPLHGAITDTHFARRNRFGRLAAFMARALRHKLVSGPRIYGVAVDEGSALLVNARGIATLVQRSKDDDGYVPKGAYILEGGPAQRFEPGKPLLYTVAVTHIAVPGSTYDLIHKRGAGRRYTVTVDGSKSKPYSRNPYE